MPKVAKVLSAVAVKALAKKPGRHSVGGVPGLCLRVTDTLSAQWVMRSMYAGKAHDIGLGGYPIIDLQAAREEARKLYLQIRQGADVVAEREKAKTAAAEQRKAVELSRVTFEQDAKDLHIIKSQEFKNAKHSAQWINTLETYAFPLLGAMEVSSIERKHVLRVLEPIWNTKTETATRVRQRIEQVLDYSHAKGHRGADNPARWKGGLDALLPKPSKLKKKRGKKRHHPALPWKRLPAFMADLRNRPRGSVAAKALELAILTASRSGEARLATWREFDLDACVWTVPAERMKAELEHRVPLVGRALELVQAQPKGKPDDLMFPSEKGSALSDNTLSKLMKDMHAADMKRGGVGYLDPKLNAPATPHGTARSSFKDWHRETRLTKYADEVSELQLAHVNSDETRSAYARGELLELRGQLMQEWSDFLSGANAHG